LAVSGNLELRAIVSGFLLCLFETRPAKRFTGESVRAGFHRCFAARFTDRES
jgi:hypothetical protein